jgi:hypothetical protein
LASATSCHIFSKSPSRDQGGFQDPQDPDKDNDDDDDDDGDDGDEMPRSFGPADKLDPVNPRDLGPDEVIDIRYSGYPGTSDSDQGADNPPQQPTSRTPTPTPAPTSTPQPQKSQRFYVFYVNYIGEICNEMEWQFSNIP